MSGAEVAGLVLGAIPLLISGLEHYEEGVRTLRKMLNSAKEFAKLKQALECEQQIFLNCLEILLRDEVGDRYVLKELLEASHNSSKWSNPRIDECLRRRLGRSYLPFLASAKSMACSIEDFRDSLELGTDGKVGTLASLYQSLVGLTSLKGPFDIDRRSVATALKRIRFGLKMRKYIEMKDDISAHNRRLCRLVDQGRALTPVVATRNRVPDFEKAREHAKTIFAGLRRTLACSCSADHRASLYMRPMEVTGAELVARRDPNRFRVVLQHPLTGGPNMAPPWVIEETEIRPLDGDPANETGVGSGSLATEHVAVQHASPTSHSQALAEIQDLCISLRQLRSSQSQCDVCLGYLADASKGCRHGLYWPNRPLVDPSSPKTISLADILDQSQGSRYMLTESDKRQLALALASGLLRLYRTPWLDLQWGRREILLFQKGGHIIARHPFISAEIPVPNQQSPSSKALSYFTSCSLIKEDTIFALGIVLIELVLEKPFETMRVAEDLNDDGSAHRLSDFCTADRLIGDVFAKAGERYANVVRRCIHCQFDEQRVSLDSASFRRKFYEGVVAELERELVDIDAL